jgi:serine/threonine protein phosphatase PrpC
VWAGDSRAYVRSAGGGLRRLTRDHSRAQELLDSGRSPGSSDGARGTHVVTRALGVSPALELDLNDGPIRTGDVFLLCSDGLTDTLGDDEIATAMDECPLEAAADRLLTMALGRKAADNVSFILVGVQ